MQRLLRQAKITTLSELSLFDDLYSISGITTDKAVSVAKDYAMPCDVATLSFDSAVAEHVVKTDVLLAQSLRYISMPDLSTEPSHDAAH